MNAWLKHLGGVRLHRITPSMVDQFITRRQAEGAAPRTVNLDVICVRNLLSRAVTEEVLKVVTIGKRKPLKGNAREREISIHAQIEAVCAAAF